MVFHNFPVALCLEAPVLPSASWFRRLILLFAGQVMVMEVSGLHQFSRFISRGKFGLEIHLQWGVVFWHPSKMS